MFTAGGFSCHGCLLNETSAVRSEEEETRWTECRGHTADKAQASPGQEDVGIGLSGEVPAWRRVSGPDASATFDGPLGPHNDVHSWAGWRLLPGKGQTLACDQGPGCLLDQVPPTTEDSRPEPFKRHLQ